MHLSFPAYARTVFLLLFIVPCIFPDWVFAQQTSPPANNKTIQLFNAIRSGSIDELNKQLANGASANDSLNGYSALMAAALNGTTEQMKILIDAGAIVNFADKDSITALWLAVPDWDKTKLLIDRGANPSLHSKEGYSVLVKLAFMPGTINIFHLLIEHGADPKKSSGDNILLYNAASTGDTAITGLLIRSGLNVNDTAFFGDYPINATFAFSLFPTLKLLVDNGANVNVAPKSILGLAPLAGCTPLMFAGLNHAKESFFYLLDHGADPNIKNVRGYTALMMLQQSETDEPAMTRALIDHGADVTVTAPDGTSALTYALQKGNTKSAAVLKKYQHQ